MIYYYVSSEILTNHVLVKKDNYGEFVYYDAYMDSWFLLNRNYSVTPIDDIEWFLNNMIRDKYKTALLEKIFKPEFYDDLLDGNI